MTFGIQLANMLLAAPALTHTSIRPRPEPSMSTASNPELSGPPGQRLPELADMLPDAAAAATTPLTRMARLVALDDRLLRRLVQNRRARATFALRVLCRLYDPDIVMMGIGVALFAPPLVDAANHIAVALILTSVLVVLVKRTVKRNRPALEVQASAPPDRFSFPSGHTAAAFSVALCMFGAVPWLAPPLLAVACLVAYARMYLGVHYPLDVACGAAIGLVTGSLVALW
jgi:undecaprenyl-diphosphatase